MGRALEVLTGRVLNPGAVLTAVTPNTGDTFVVKSYSDGSRARLFGMWAEAATAGIMRIRSTKFHDPVQGIRFRVIANSVRAFITGLFFQPLIMNDPLIVELSGGAAETDVAVALVYYDDLPGSDAQLATWPQIKDKIVNLYEQEVIVTGPATAGDWSAGRAINADFDNMKANTYYALLGYVTDTQCAAVAVRGPETANLRVGGPGTTEAIETREFFIRLYEKTGEATIPVINSANRGSTQVFCADNAAAATLNVGLVMAELSSGV